jgi:lipid II:glycine glycyltransferase (peptidoglycan interpeptide bridge formation enzyme)
MKQRVLATVAHYQSHISTDPEDPAWDTFVASVPDGHHVQTSRWGQVKGVLGWQTVRLVMSQAGEIVGGGQLLIRPVRYLGKVGYVTKGPVMASNDPVLARRILEELRSYGRANHLRYFAVQPPSNGAYIADCLQEMGFRATWLELAPTATLVFDLTQDLESIMERLKRQTRQNIRRSRREGITVREGTAADLDTFYRLHVSTSERQHFVPYPKNYFLTMWRAFESSGHIGLLLAEFKGEPVSALLLVPFGSTVIAKLFGWSGEHGQRRPNEAVFWEAIKWAQEHGYRCFDMEGIDPASARATLNGQSLPDELRDSADFFKLGFGGQVMLYPVAYDYVYNTVLRGLYRTFARPALFDLPIVQTLLNSLRQHE